VAGEPWRASRGRERGNPLTIRTSSNAVFKL
jgi:hypothetical protein